MGLPIWKGVAEGVVEVPGSVGEEVAMIVGVEEELGEGEGVVADGGLEMFCATNRETNKETISAAAIRTETKISFLRFLRICIRINSENKCIFICSANSHIQNWFSC